MAKLSTQGTDLIVGREGKVLKCYLDAVGLPTVGIGHLARGMKVGTRITNAQCMALFETDIARFEAAVNNAIKVPLKQNEFDALVSLSFNIGTASFIRSTLVKKINARAPLPEIQKAFMMWRIPASIIPRRKGEWLQFAGTHFVARA